MRKVPNMPKRTYLVARTTEKKFKQMSSLSSFLKLLLFICRSWVFKRSKRVLVSLLRRKTEQRKSRWNRWKLHSLKLLKLHNKKSTTQRKQKKTIYIVFLPKFRLRNTFVTNSDLRPDRTHVNIFQHSILQHCCLHVSHFWPPYQQRKTKCVVTDMLHWNVVSVGLSL